MIGSKVVVGTEEEVEVEEVEMEEEVEMKEEVEVDDEVEVDEVEVEVVEEEDPLEIEEVVAKGLRGPRSGEIAAIVVDPSPNSLVIESTKLLNEVNSPLASEMIELAAVGPNKLFKKSDRSASD